MKRLEINDYIGKRYSNLTIINLIKKESGNRIRFFANCKCKCGAEKEINLDDMRYGKIISCGCVKKKRASKVFFVHGLKKNPIYSHWNSITQRCNNKNNTQYHRYGGRGIYVCDEWNGVNGVKNFIEWSYKNGYRKGLEVDRINNDGPYSPENCRWTTRKNNLRNTSRNRFMTYNGETKTVIEWAEILGINDQTIRGRMYAGWTDHDALCTPVDKTGKTRKNNRNLTYKGETKCLADWSRITGIKYNTLIGRMKSGWSSDKILETSVEGN